MLFFSLIFTGTVWSADTLLTATGSDSLRAPIHHDSLGGKVLTDSTSKDSLHAGKVEKETGIVLVGNRAWGGAFTFLIPMIRELASLRSSNENGFVNIHMVQDAGARFDDNDIAWPVGVVLVRSFGKVLRLRGEVAYLQTSNRNRWVPKENDTVISVPYVNSYSLKVIHTVVGAEFSLDPTLLTADGFDRVYLGASGEFAPLILFSIERTELNQKFTARGYGVSMYLYAGVEKNLNERYSMGGELGYVMGNWGGFTRNGQKLLFSDVKQSGGNEVYTLGIRALKIRLFVLRWF